VLVFDFAAAATKSHGLRFRVAWTHRRRCVCHTSTTIRRYLWLSAKQILCLIRWWLTLGYKATRKTCSRLRWKFLYPFVLCMFWKFMALWRI